MRTRYQTSNLTVFYLKVMHQILDNRKVPKRLSGTMSCYFFTRLTPENSEHYTELQHPNLWQLEILKFRHSNRTVSRNKSLDIT